MNTEDGIKTKAAIPLDTGRSYFEWENGMLVIRRGKGENSHGRGRACKVLRSYMEKSQWQTSGDNRRFHPVSR